MNKNSFKEKSSEEVNYFRTFLMLMFQIFKENIFISHTKTVDYLN